MREGLASLPKTLVTHSQRFQQTMNGGVASVSKMQTPVRQYICLSFCPTYTIAALVILMRRLLSLQIDVPDSLEIDVAPLLLPSMATDPPVDSRYLLQSFVSHTGPSTRSGHYVTYRRDLQRNVWILADDEKETQIVSNKEILEAARRSYLLFWTRSAEAPLQGAADWSLDVTVSDGGSEDGQSTGGRSPAALDAGNASPDDDDGDGDARIQAAKVSPFYIKEC